jgi:PAS domain S-box-containing protein
MRRFILEANVARYEGLLQTELSAADRAMVRTLLLADRRELTLLEATQFGASRRVHRAPEGDEEALSETFLREFANSPRILMLLDPGPQLRIVDCNEALCRAAGRTRDYLVGKPMFEAFPENPGDPMAEGAVGFYASLRIAAESRRAHAMKTRRYDVLLPDGSFEEHHWQAVNTPLFDAWGRLVYLMCEGRDVTEDVRSAAEGSGATMAETERQG